MPNLKLKHLNDIMSKLTRILVLWISLLFFYGGTIHYAHSQSGGVVIIIHKDNPIPNMTQGQVKLYYLRKIRKRWAEIEKNIRPVDISGNSAIKNVFLNKVLGMTIESMNQYFTQKQYANAETPPTKVATDMEMLNYVAQNIGAIGYVSYETYQANSGKVKAVLFIK
jgi:ABC-type phosphate transport system substrate-binding protein